MRKMHEQRLDEEGEIDGGVIVDIILSLTYIMGCPSFVVAVWEVVRGKARQSKTGR